MILTAYVSVKGAYQAAVFEARVEERNLLYLTPLLFDCARALRGNPRAHDLGARGRGSPDRLVDQLSAAQPGGLEGDAPGLAILSRLA